MTNEELNYKNYIDEHIENVKLAHLRYGDDLCVLLDLAPLRLAINVSNHDKSKYEPEEFDAYRQWFYPTGNRNKELFDKAWEHHYTVNSHHPEYWVKDGTPMDMDKYAIAEMLLDWAAMAIKFGGTAYTYYEKERDKKPFSENTKKTIDNIIYIFKK